MKTRKILSLALAVILFLCFGSAQAVQRNASPVIVDTNPVLGTSDYVVSSQNAVRQAIAAAVAGGVGSQTANYFFAAPNGSAGTPAFRAVVSADLPDLSGIYQPKSSVLTTYAGLTPSANAQTLLGHTFSQMLSDIGTAPAFTSGTANYFWATPNGSSGVPSLRAIVAADIPTLNQSTSGNAATATAATNLAGTGVGSLPYQSASGSTSYISDVTAGQPLLSGGTATYPAYAGYYLSGIGSATYTLPASSKTLMASDYSNAGTAPTWNQSTTGTAAGASLWGLYGSISGPSSAHTYTFPDASATMLYSGGALGTPISGTLTNCTFPTLNQNTSGTAANLSGTPALPNGTTATTQTQADASTKLATTAYVDTGLGGKQAASSVLTTYAGITPSANVQTLLGAANYAAFKSSLAIDQADVGGLATGAVPYFAGLVVPSISPIADFALNQSSVAPFTSISSGALVNTLYLKAGCVGIGTPTPGTAKGGVLEINPATDSRYRLHVVVDSGGRGWRVTTSDFNPAGSAGSAFVFSLGAQTGGTYGILGLYNYVVGAWGNFEFMGNVGIGTPSPTISGTGRLDMNADTFRLRSSRTPASAGAAGNAGEICWDSSYIYICVATNSWKRAAIAAW